MQKPNIDWPKVAQLVLLSRELDLLEEEHLAPQGKIKYQFSAKGHELSQILLALALTHPHDAAAPDIPIPYNIPMMDSILPSVESIKLKLEDLIAY